MADNSLPPPPPSPGVAQRRRGPKSLPRLPISAFTPPNSGTAESFPFPPSPGTAHPVVIVDAHVIATPAQLPQWKKDAGEVLSEKIGGVILSLHGNGSQVDKALEELQSSPSGTHVISVAVPFRLEDPPPTTPPSFLSSKIPTSLCTVYTENTPACVAGLRWALQQGRPIDIDIQANMNDADAVWENFEDLVTKSTADLTNPAPIILTNVLPPPHALSLPLVQLMNHPTYRAYQTQTAALSLFPNIYIKFLPPAWGAPTPATPAPGSHALRATYLVPSQTPLSAVPQSALTPSSGSPAMGLWAGKTLEAEKAESQQLKEWKRRIRMYLGPVLEAFGFSRIIFGSSPSPSSRAQSNAGDWYEIARESILELGVDQEAVDSVFGTNAKKIYETD